MNYRLSRARIVVELAFGRLKARWRRLLKQSEMVVENVPNVVTACCILHNMCEIHGETFDQTWIKAEDTTQFIQPHTSSPDDDFEQSYPVFTRNILVQYLSN